MDFIHDALMNGRKFRTLNIIDDYNGEALRVEPFFSIGTALVIKVLQRLILERGKPDSIRMDNGPEFIASALKDWCKDIRDRTSVHSTGKTQAKRVCGAF